MILPTIVIPNFFSKNPWRILNHKSYHLLWKQIVIWKFSAFGNNAWMQLVICLILLAEFIWKILTEFWRVNCVSLHEKFDNLGNNETWPQLMPVNLHFLLLKNCHIPRILIFLHKLITTFRVLLLWSLRVFKYVSSCLQISHFYEKKPLQNFSKVWCFSRKFILENISMSWKKSWLRNVLITHPPLLPNNFVFLLFL